MMPNPLAQRFGDLRQWTAWRTTPDGRKLPITHGGKAASIADPNTWLTLNEAESLVRNVSMEQGGIMLALTPELRLLCVDFDGALTVNRITNPAAHEFILAVQSYTEISPSRKGLHVWLELDEPWKLTRCKLPSAEVYAEKRFMTVTGWQIQYDGSYAVIDQHESFLLRKVSISEAKRLLALLGYSESEPKPTTAAKLVPTANGSRRLTQRQAEGLIAFVARQREGNRNHALYWAANRLRECGATVDVATAALLPAALYAGLPEREARRTIASAWREATHA